MTSEVYTYLRQWAATAKCLVAEAEMRLVASFYVLCVINFSITCVRSDLEKMLEGMISLHGDVLFRSPSCLVQQCLGLFFYFYSGSLWDDNKAVFCRYLEYVATMASTPSMEPIAVEQACCTLRLLATEEIMLVKIEDNIPQILKIMASGISTHTKSEFFESLAELASCYVYLLDEDLFSVLVSQLVARIQVENT